MNDLIEAFYQSYEKCYSPLSAVRMPDTPAEMVLGEDTNSLGWVRWRPIRCQRQMEQEWCELEAEAGTALPSLFKQWYCAYYTLDVDVAVARLPAHWPNRGLAPVREALLSTLHWFTRPRSLGLVPFGGAEAFLDAGPLCFDARSGSDPKTWPVVFWDHDGPNEVEGPIFSSFAMLLMCCTHYTNRVAEIESRLRGRHDECRRQAGRVLVDFFELDPDGAGSAGRDYWSSFMEGLQF